MSESDASDDDSGDDLALRDAPPPAAPPPAGAVSAVDFGDVARLPSSPSPAPGRGAAAWTASGPESGGLSRDPVPPWCGWLAVLSVLVLPWPDLARGLPGADALAVDAKRALQLAWFEPVLALAALARLAAGARTGMRAFGRELRRWAAATWPVFALVGAAAWSCWGWPAGEGWGPRALPAPGLAAKTFAQWTEYLWVAPFVWLPPARDAVWRGRMVGALAAGFAVAAAGAWIATPWTDIYFHGAAPHAVGGWFANRHAYTLAAGVAACLFTGAWLERGRRVGTTPLSALGWFAPGALLLAPSLSLGALAAAGAGLGTTWAAGRRGLAWLLLPLALWLGWGAAPALVAAQRTVAAWTGGDGTPAPRGGTGGGEATRTTEAGVAHRRGLARSIQVLWPDESAAGAPERLSRRYARWAAELNMAAAHPLSGVGVGQYGKRVNDFAAEPARDRARTDRPEEYDRRVDEPMTFGWFFVLAGETGWLGLAAGIMLLAEMVGRGVGMGRRGRCVYAAGVAGAGVALLGGGIWTGLLARGVGPLVGLVLAFSATPGEDEDESA